MDQFAATRSLVRERIAERARRNQSSTRDSLIHIHNRLDRDRLQKAIRDMARYCHRAMHDHEMCRKHFVKERRRWVKKENALRTRLDKLIGKPHRQFDYASNTSNAPSTLPRLTLGPSADSVTAPDTQITVQKVMANNKNSDTGTLSPRLPALPGENALITPSDTNINASPPTDAVSMTDGKGSDIQSDHPGVAKSTKCPKLPGLLSSVHMVRPQTTNDGGDTKPLRTTCVKPPDKKGSGVTHSTRLLALNQSEIEDYERQIKQERLRYRLLVQSRDYVKAQDDIKLWIHSYK